jgi:polyhydroxybutyrate depolymerase
MKPSSIARSSLMVLTFFIMAVAILHTGARACGRDTDCSVGKRIYRIALPGKNEQAAPTGAILFVHGYHGKAEGEMQNSALIAAATDHGIAFVAAQAAGAEWNLPGVPSADAILGIDELAYFDAVAADLNQRFGIDPKKIVVAGFSSGAMMVWQLACYRGDAFAGFVPVSGTFWKPLPKSCAARSVKLIHYHGTKDHIVPIHGRPIKDGQQGDVYAAIDLITRTGDYRSVAADKIDGLDCSRRTSSAGGFVELCLFTGVHELRANYLERAWSEIMTSMGH